MANINPYLGPALSILGTGFSAASQLMKGDAAELVGRRRQQAAAFDVAQLEQNAGQAEAGGQRAAIDVKRQVDLINSAALARAAASGAGASDPTVVNIMAKTQQEGAYRQALALYQGESAARMSRMKAAAAQYEGDIAVEDAAKAKNLSRFAAASTVLTGSGSMYSKYFSQPDAATS